MLNTLEKETISSVYLSISSLKSLWFDTVISCTGIYQKDSYKYVKSVGISLKYFFW